MSEFGANMHGKQSKAWLEFLAFCKLGKSVLYHHPDWVGMDRNQFEEIQSLHEKLAKAEDSIKELRGVVSIHKDSEEYWSNQADLAYEKTGEEIKRRWGLEEKIKSLESLVLAQSLAIEEKDNCMEYVLTTNHDFNGREYLVKAKNIIPSPELGAKIVETLEKAKSNCGYIERTLPVMVKQMGEEYGKFLPNLLKEIISQSEDLLRLIRETGSNSK
jgi:hypothetical protein